MAKLIIDIINEFLDNLYQEGYIYTIRTLSYDQLVRTIHEILKPYEKKYEIKEATTE